MIEIGSHSARGLRTRNEDAALAWKATSGSTSGAAAIVADGMGGLDRGEEASQRVLAACRTVIDRSANESTHEPLWMKAAAREACAASHLALLELTQDSGTETSVGSTLVVLLAFGTRFVVAHVGDSRCYYANDLELRQLTTDHALREVGRTHVLTDSLGDALHTAPALTPAVADSGLLDEPCVFVLTSDGVHQHVHADVLHYHATRWRSSPQAIATELVDAALANGSTDNASAAVLRYWPSFWGRWRLKARRR